jgi:hypothetical protein
LRQFCRPPQCCDFLPEFSFEHVVKLCACRESLNGVKLRFYSWVNKQTKVLATGQK